MDDVTPIEYISDLFRFRVQALVAKLAAMSAALKKGGMTDYEVNMMGTSDLI